MRASVCERFDSGAGYRGFRIEPGEADLEKVVVAGVEQDVGIQRHDQDDPGDHLEHVLAHEQVDRALRLSRRSREVEDHLAVLLPERELDRERPVTASVVVDAILEDEGLLGDERVDHDLGRVSRPLEQPFARAPVHVDAEPLA